MALWALDALSLSKRQKAVKKEWKGGFYQELGLKRARWILKIHRHELLLVEGGRPEATGSKCPRSPAERRERRWDELELR